MSKAEEVKLDIKVVINKEKTKVLFAEAGSDFTDVLLSFLLLPLGTIVKVLKKHYGDEAPVIGSLSTLYNGVENLDSIHFQTDSSKSMLLDPTSRYETEFELHKLRLKVNSTEPKISNSGKSYNGVFTQSAACYIISDDLRVMPNVAGSIMKTLSTLGIDVTDMDGVETRNVTFGLNEIMALLRESLVSRNPLTIILLCGRQLNLTTVISEQLNQIDEKATSANSKKMILKVLIQKSNNKLVFAQADQDFINFLFGVLTIPLGKVEWYFGSNTGLKSLDNLHRSIAENSKNMHMKSSETKCSLINPTLARRYCFRSTSNEFYHLNFDPSDNQSHVKEVRMYMVSDDLNVAPLSVTSCLSTLDGLKISLSDVKELELQVGLEEGLNILKTALTSTTALTDGLIKAVLMKQPSQEMDVQIGVEEDRFVNQIPKKRPKQEC
ncbi:hypothetical protein C2S51_003988 [Perilla frutescens var. frutescens]|nr:hypothetical protein C2S51_003988 [Perilla frutescens var. frutescens]